MHPLRAKLGHADMMRNIDALHRDAFKSGKRAGQRRRGISTVVNFEHQSGQKEVRDQKKEEEAHITNMLLSNDSEPNSNPEATVNTIDTKMAKMVRLFLSNTVTAVTGMSKNVTFLLSKIICAK